MHARAYVQLRKYAIAYKKSCVLSGLVSVLNHRLVIFGPMHSAAHETNSVIRQAGAMPSPPRELDSLFPYLRINKTAINTVLCMARHLH